MNILIVSHGIPSKEDPQWGCFELDQARALRSLGHIVSIVAVDGRLRRGWGKFGFLHSDFDGIDACRFFLFPLRLIPNAKMRVWIRDRMMLRLFRHMVSKHGYPDVIYAHYFFAISQLYTVKRVYPQIPIIGVEHAGRIIQNEVFSKGDLIHFDRAYLLADKLLSVSPALQDALYKKFGVKSDVLFDMVGQEFLDAELVQKVHRPFKFVTTGSLVKDKAIDMIVKALAKVEDQTSELYIIGDGPEREGLTYLVSSLGLSERVRLMGMCDKQQIIEIYKECDVFVLASRLETFCVVNIEAMAMGLPVISTRCGGPEYYITEKNGILLDVDDFDGLVSAMNTIGHTIFNPKSQREFVRSHFSGKVIACQLEKIMEVVVNQKNQQID